MSGENDEVYSVVSSTMPPKDLPAWLKNVSKDHVFMPRGVFNYDIYGLKKLAQDLNAVAVGHAMAYEDIVKGKQAKLETKTFDKILWVLNHPPEFMPDEGEISPTFSRKFGVLEQVFDWGHFLHAQTLDVLASKDLTFSEKDKKINQLWDFYFTQLPYAVSPLPMNMGYLDNQKYSGGFRSRFPKTNALFWGYHWLQGIVYDMLYQKTESEQKKAYDIIGERYHTIELFKTKRPFMPMVAELSPRFAEKFPHVANAFDNLHMLHDMVNDILVSDKIPWEKKDDAITEAILMLSAATHKNEKPGDVREIGGLHDHRFMKGMPGMGLMPHSTEEVMWMEGMGWMSMEDCHHCSMPLPEGKRAWEASSIMAEGWSMRVRCALCARDMAFETKGKAILHLATENPEKPVIIFSSNDGTLSTDNFDVVFLEEEGGHAGCHKWSQAFTSQAAFEKFTHENHKYKNAQALSFSQWSDRIGKKPDTYVKPLGPEGNPFDKK
ncbi:MAG: hypothetical protein ACKVQC_09135 [Elusimicrobiota bacterium]